MRISDWSSDVCSSDLFVVFGVLLVVSVVAARGTLRQGPPLRWGDAFTTASTFANHLGQNATLSLYDAARDRKSVVEGKSVSVRVDLGGGRIIKKKKKQEKRL